jgi:hypothetical protein
MMASPKVPNTISDRKMADLQRRAQKTAPPMFSREATAKRLASNLQRQKRQSS